MDFQFLEDFKKLSVVCPPKNYKPKNRAVYRWVFDDIADERNFKPRFYLVPEREFEKVAQIKDKKKRDAKKCAMLALSMFISKETAIERFNDLKDDMGKKAYIRLGTKIAFAHIIEEDGVNEEPNEIGHFNHHPITNHNYEKRFEIISTL